MKICKHDRIEFDHILKGWYCSKCNKCFSHEGDGYLELSKMVSINEQD
jgi:hypothetical protein